MTNFCSLPPFSPSSQHLALSLPSRLRLRHIPGPFAPPIVGNALAFARDGQVASFAKWHARYGPIFKMRLGAADVVVVADAAAGRRVNLRNPRRHPLMPPLVRTKHAAAGSRGLFASGALDPVFHREMKAAWLPMFHGAVLDGFAADMAAGADALATSLAGAAAAGAAVDVWRALGGMTMSVVLQSAFGVADVDTLAAHRSPEAESLLSAARDVFAAGRFASAYGVAFAAAPWARPLITRAATRWPDAPLKRLENARGVLMDRAVAIVAAARAEQAEGKPASSSFLARLVQRSADFSDADLAAQAFTFLLAGYETTATSLAFTVALLARHPAAAAALAAEIDAAPSLDAAASGPYLHACYKEALRLYPPAPMTLRVAEVDQDVGGYHVPAGTWLQVDLLAIHRDPALWGPDADAFVPDRWIDGTPAAARRPKDAYFPFGDAALRCVGAAFAQREAHITLARLFARFSFEPVGGADTPLELECRLTLAPKGGVQVRPVERAGARWAAVKRVDSDDDIPTPGTPPASDAAAAVVE